MRRGGDPRVVAGEVGRRYAARHAARTETPPMTVTPP